MADDLREALEAVARREDEDLDASAALDATTHMTCKEAAAFLRCSERTVHDLLLRGVIVGFRVGKLWRIRKSVILAFVTNQEKAQTR